MWFHRRLKKVLPAKKEIAIDYHDVPFLNREDVRVDDTVTHVRIYADTNSAHVCMEMIFRPSTKELFRLECWDEKHTSYVAASADCIEDDEQPAFA